MLEKFREQLKPISEFVAKPFLRLDPNVISLLGFLIGFIPIYFYLAHKPLLAGISMIVYAFDSIDGAVARMNNKVTKFGAVLDATLDRIIDGAIIFAIAEAGYVTWELAILVFSGSFLVSYVRARVEGASSNSFKMNVGIAQRGDRLILIMLASIFYFDNIFNRFNSFEIVFPILAILAWITVLWRLLYSFKNLK